MGREGEHGGTKFMFCRSCSFFNGWKVESYDCFRLIFCGFFREMHQKKVFFGGSRRVSQESSLPLRHRSFLPQFLAALPAVAWPTEIGFGEVTKTHLNAGAFWGLLTLKELFIFISLHKYDGIRDVIEWCVNIWHWYVKKCNGYPSTISQLNIHSHLNLIIGFLCSHV